METTKRDEATQLLLHAQHVAAELERLHPRRDVKAENSIEQEAAFVLRRLASRGLPAPPSATDLAQLFSQYEAEAQHSFAAEPYDFARWLAARLADGLPAAPPDGPFTGEAPGADLRARVAELEVALAPFAKMADAWESAGSETKVGHYQRGTATVGDLRRARTALGEGRPE